MTATTALHSAVQPCGLQCVTLHLRSIRPFVGPPLSDEGQQLFYKRHITAQYRAGGHTLRGWGIRATSWQHWRLSFSCCCTPNMAAEMGPRHAIRVGSGRPVIQRDTPQGDAWPSRRRPLRKSWFRRGENATKVRAHEGRARRSRTRHQRGASCSSSAGALSRFPPPTANAAEKVALRCQEARVRRQIAGKPPRGRTTESRREKKAPV